MTHALSTVGFPHSLKKVAQHMGGSIGVESQQGAWSLFWFSIKLDVASSTPPAEWVPRPDLHGLRVLCVDDNPTNLFLLESAAASWGMEVTTLLEPTSLPSDASRSSRVRASF